MDKSITSKTGSATIQRFGHTISGAYGSEPNAKRRGIAQEPADAIFPANGGTGSGS